MSDGTELAGEIIGKLIGIAIDGWFSYKLGCKFGFEVGCVCFLTLRILYAIYNKLPEKKR